MSVKDMYFNIPFTQEIIISQKQSKMIGVNGSGLHADSDGVKISMKESIFERISQFFSPRFIVRDSEKLQGSTIRIKKSDSVKCLADLQEGILKLRKTAIGEK